MSNRSDKPATGRYIQQRRTKMSRLTFVVLGVMAMAGWTGVTALHAQTAASAKTNMSPDKGKVTGAGRGHVGSQPSGRFGAVRSR